MILLSCDWSEVHSTTEVPKQRRVVTLLSGLCLLSAMGVPAGQLIEQSALAGVCGLTSVWIRCNCLVAEASQDGVAVVQRLDHLVYSENRSSPNIEL